MLTPAQPIPPTATPDPRFALGERRFDSAQIVSDLNAAIDAVFSHRLALAAFPLSSLMDVRTGPVGWLHRNPASSTFTAQELGPLSKDTINEMFSRGARQQALAHGVPERTVGALMDDAAEFYTLAVRHLDFWSPASTTAYGIAATGAGPTPWLHIDAPFCSGTWAQYISIGATLVADCLDNGAKSPLCFTGRGMMFVPDELVPRAELLLALPEFRARALRSGSEVGHSLYHRFSYTIDRIVKEHLGNDPSTYLLEVPQGYGCVFRGGTETGLVHGSPVLREIAQRPMLTDRDRTEPHPEAGLLRRHVVMLDAQLPLDERIACYTRSLARQPPTFLLQD